MAAYVCEYQARELSMRPEVAAAFKEAALRAARAAEPYAREKPLRFIKNLFPPETRHGRDSTYGEYAVYALLAASLFARTALVCDDSIPALATAGASCGTLLDLWPAFHKVFATCGDTNIEIDTRSQPGYDATGLGRFHRRGAPPDLGMSMGIAAQPKYVVHGAETDRSVAIGPCWRTLAGEWQTLAQLSSGIEAATVTTLRCSPDAVEWEIEWSVDSTARLPVTSIAQRYALAPGRLEVGVSVHGVYECLGFEVPCLVTEGRGPDAEIAVSAYGAVVRQRGWRLDVTLGRAARYGLEEIERANRHARYRVARFWWPASSAEIELALTHEGAH
jgi:hypothetical protein